MVEESKMSKELAARVVTLKPSATVEMTERVRKARASGRKIFGLSSGDPNIDTDPRIIASAESAMRRGATRYGPPAGLESLREAVATRELKRSGAVRDPGDVIITPGGKFALLTALMGTIEPGDEVLIPDPGWVSYGPCVRLCGGVPIAVSMLDRIDIGALTRVLSPRTQAIILNSPVNPTGRVFSKAEIQSVVDFADHHDLWIFFDQVYSDLLYQNEFPSPQGMQAGLDRVFVIDSFSKTFGMTGWRLGALVTPPGRAKTILKFIQHSIYCVPEFIQLAGVTALSFYDELVPQYRKLFHARLDRAAARLSSIDGVSCTVPPATFYLFPSVACSDVELARKWLDGIDVATVPGSSFGEIGAGHLRLSLTCSDGDLDEALSRMERAGVAL